MTVEQPVANPFDSPTTFNHIALALSGGGFRAAAYHLGTLNILYLLGLLDRVHMLSTVSGGSIIGAFYALKRKLGVDFATIYGQFYEFLATDELLDNAVAKWKTACESGSSDYKLIQAFAEVYDEYLFDHQPFGALWEHGQDSHLDYVIFNATELYSGLAFRFQYGKPTPYSVPDGARSVRFEYLIGNGNLYIDHDLAKQLRLADVVAASSCFPGGFEPFVLPDDFKRSSPEPFTFYQSNDQTLPIQRVALLDGGIYDNQGTDSLKIVNQRLTNLNRQLLPNEPALPTSTLLVISDVDSAGINLFETPEQGPIASVGRRLKTLPSILTQTATGCFLLAGICTLYQLTVFIWPNVAPAAGFVTGMLSGVFLTVGVITSVAMGWIKRKVSELKQILGSVFSPALGPVSNMTIDQVIYLLKIRLSSVYALLDAIFLRRIRTLNYGATEQNPGWIRLSSVLDRMIRDMTNPKIAPSEKKELLRIQRIIDVARQMKTTLWWQDNQYRLDAIVASAELTFCYQTRKHLANEANRVKAGVDVVDLERKLALIWQAYQEAGVSFRLHPTMKPALDNPICTVQDLIAAATELNIKAL